MLTSNFKRPSWWPRALVQHYSVLKDATLKDSPSSVFVDGASSFAPSKPDIDLLLDMVVTVAPPSAGRVLVDKVSGMILPGSPIGSDGKALVWRRRLPGWRKVGQRLKVENASVPNSPLIVFLDLTLLGVGGLKWVF